MSKYINQFQEEKIVNSKIQFEVINMLGVDVHLLTTLQLLDLISESITQGSHTIILNTNVHFINLTRQNSWLLEFQTQADYLFCDGAGVMLGARILGYTIPERITYADWIWQLAALAETQQFTFYFLGARVGVAEKAEEQLKNIFPKLQVVGTHHGYFDKTPGSVENEEIIKNINSVKPNILIIGFGMPVQERWIMENWEHIDTNVVLTGGAVFDYISGNLRRAPSWMTDNGMEWLGRVFIEPRRLWRRYIIGNPLFLWRIFLQRFGILRI